MEDTGLLFIICIALAIIALTAIESITRKRDRKRETQRLREEAEIDQMVHEIRTKPLSRKRNFRKGIL